MNGDDQTGNQMPTSDDTTQPTNGGQVPTDAGLPSEPSEPTTPETPIGGEGQDQPAEVPPPPPTTTSEGDASLPTDQDPA